MEPNGLYKRSLLPLKPTDYAAGIGVIVVDLENAEEGIAIHKPGQDAIEYRPLAHLRDVFESACESMVITPYGFPNLFKQLHDTFKSDERWQYRAVVQEMEGDARVSTVVSYFGFRRTDHKRKRRDRYFYPVNVDTFVQNLKEFKGTTEAEQLMTFGIALRDFCRDKGIRPKTTGAGLASQLLKHPDFYPEARRRIPKFINEIARLALPGNHYELTGHQDEEIESLVYIDQKAAHHYAAKTTPLPSSNSLVARGHGRSGSPDTAPTHPSYEPGTPWLYPGEPSYDHVLRHHHGLLRLRLHIPQAKDARFAPPLVWQNQGRTIDALVWTNELEYLLTFGCEIKYIIAAYTAKERDRGLPKYAEWAEGQPAWLKQTLLTTYGVLAARTRNTRFVHHDGKGEDVQLPLGPCLIDGKAGTIRETHSGIANTVHRGLIESYVRVLSLSLSRELTERHGEVISIYGDGIFVKVEKGEQLALPLPWREKRVVHNITFESPTRLRSDEITRLPGTPRFFREYVRQT